MECLPSRASSSLLGSCQQAVGSVRPMLRSDRHVARPAPGGSSRGSHCGGGAPPSPRHARLPALAAMVPNGYGGEPDAKVSKAVGVGGRPARKPSRHADVACNTRALVLATGSATQDNHDELCQRLQPQRR